MLFENLLEEAFLLARVALAERGGEGGKKLLLLRRKIFRRLDDDCEYQVAAALGVDVGDTLTAKGEGGARLRTLGNSEFFGLAAKDGDVYLGSERSLREGNRYLTEYIVALAVEYRVGTDSYVDNKVAVGAAVSACRALTSKHYSLTVVNSRGNRYVELLVNFDKALAVAVLAGRLYNLTRTAAILAGALSLHIAEHRLLLHRHRTAASARRAGAQAAVSSSAA